jgi:hypothetical protein
LLQNIYRVPVPDPSLDVLNSEPLVRSITSRTTASKKRTRGNVSQDQCRVLTKLLPSRICDDVVTMAMPLDGSSNCSQCRRCDVLVDLLMKSRNRSYDALDCK